MARPRRYRAHQPEPGIGRAPIASGRQHADSVARWRSRDMIERDYFSHDIPGYGRSSSASIWKGYCYVLAGEHRLEHVPRRRTAEIHAMFMDRPAIGTTSSSGAGGDRRRRVQGVGRQEDVDRPVRGQVRSHGQGGTEGHPASHPRFQAPDDAEAHAQADSQAHAVPDAGADAGADREPDAGSAHPADSDARAPSGRGAGARRTSGDDGDGTAGRVVVLDGGLEAIVGSVAGLFGA